MVKPRNNFRGLCEQVPPEKVKLLAEIAKQTKIWERTHGPVTLSEIEPRLESGQKKMANRKQRGPDITLKKSKVRFEG